MKLIKPNIYQTEFLGKEPKWITRWGNSFLFLLMFFIVLFSFFYKYYDVVKSDIIVTSKNPPIYIRTKKTGRLNNVFIEPGQVILKGTLLAEIENNASYQDISLLKNNLAQHYLNISKIDSIDIYFPPNYILGENQILYGNFISKYKTFLLLSSLNKDEKTTISLSLQLSSQYLLIKRKEEQLNLSFSSLEISKISFNRQTELFNKGVISKSEFDDAQSKYLNAQKIHQDLYLNLTTLKQALYFYENQKQLANINQIENSTNILDELEFSYQELLNGISLWEKDNLLVSPIYGKVSVFDIWSQYQNVSIDDVVFTVVPQNTTDLIGRINVDVKFSSRVRIGQKVIIKLDNYPYQEYGTITGTITNISDVPKNENGHSFYTLYISITSLKTSYGKLIDFKQEMQGTSEIITEEITIARRIFYQFRKLWDG